VILFFYDLLDPFGLILNKARELFSSLLALLFDVLQALEFGEAMTPIGMGVVVSHRGVRFQESTSPLRLFWIVYLKNEGHKRGK
jgi:hypothetical protein